MVDADSFLHLARPLGPNVGGSLPTTSPLNVIIQPQVSVPGSYTWMGNFAHTPSRLFFPSWIMLFVLIKTKYALSVPFSVSAAKMAKKSKFGIVSQLAIRNHRNR